VEEGKRERVREENVLKSKSKGNVICDRVHISFNKVKSRLNVKKMVSYVTLLSLRH